MAFYVIRTRDVPVPTTTESAVVREQIRRLGSQMQSAQAAIRRLEAQVEAIRRSAEAAVPVATAVGDGVPVGVFRLRL